MARSTSSARLHFATLCAGGIIGALASAVISYFIFRPPAYAHFYCNHYDGSAPLTVSCDNESQYATRVVWDFGDRTPIRVGNSVSHEYLNGRSKPYYLTLTAFGEGKNASYTQGIAVRASTTIVTPFTVALSAKLSGNTVKTEKICDISFMKDDHPGVLSASTRTFTSRACSVDPGFRIRSTRFVVQSSSGASPPEIHISGHRDAATVSTSLTSGPIVNQYRSWLAGELLLSEEGFKPEANGVNLVQELHAAAYKTYPLSTGLSMGDIKALHLTVDGKPIAWKDPSKPLELAGLESRLALVEQNGGLSLLVEKDKQ